MTNQVAKVTLVGAGPGAADLITVRGLNALKSADVVLYDALANDELLEYVPNNALKIYVGKRANQHRYEQEEINNMLVQYALNFGHVVRLKGGDPFVFGRGHEELEYVRRFGVEAAVIPGISSCIAVPELTGIPLTRRGVAESFWVVTATTRTGDLSDDIHYVAHSSATAVILMGMGKLNLIVDAFQAAGKGNLAVKIIQNGSKPNEKSVLGTVSTIQHLVKENQLGAPAIILIGEVAKLGHATKIAQPLSYSSSY